MWGVGNLKNAKIGYLKENPVVLDFKICHLHAMDVILLYLIWFSKEGFWYHYIFSLEIFSLKDSFPFEYVLK